MFSLQRRGRRQKTEWLLASRAGATARFSRVGTINLRGDFIEENPCLKDQLLVYWLQIAQLVNPKTVKKPSIHRWK
jgi:hypothetical protein